MLCTLLRDACQEHNAVHSIWLRLDLRDLGDTVTGWAAQTILPSLRSIPRRRLTSWSRCIPPPKQASSLLCSYPCACMHSCMRAYAALWQPSTAPWWPTARCCVQPHPHSPVTPSTHHRPCYRLPAGIPRAAAPAPPAASPHPSLRSPSTPPPTTTPCPLSQPR